MDQLFSNTSLFSPGISSPTKLGPQGMLNVDGRLNCRPTDDNSPEPPKIDLEKVAQGVALILEGIGENLQRDGLLDTPGRVARLYQELLYGTGQDPAAEITCTFQEESENLILVRDIPFTSLCEHHLVPFMGKAHIGYLPSAGKITGLSKLARVVELAARKLQVQERMTAEIAKALDRKLAPLGVIVILEAEHLCMSIRGVRKSAMTNTMAFRGCYKDNRELRQEALSLIMRGF